MKARSYAQKYTIPNHVHVIPHIQTHIYKYTYTHTYILHAYILTYTHTNIHKSAFVYDAVLERWGTDTCGQKRARDKGTKQERTAKRT